MPKSLGVQLGTRDGSGHGTKVTGVGTSTNGNNTTKNAKVKECVREDVLLNTKFKR
jgi:hypothetical protein